MALPYTQNTIYDGANSKWVRSGLVSQSFNDNAAAASQTTATLGILGQKVVSMAATLGDIKGTPSGNTLDVKLQVSVDGSTNWTDVTGGGITQLTAAGTNVIVNKALTGYGYMRAFWTLAFTGGSTPTADVTIKVTTTE